MFRIPAVAEPLVEAIAQAHVFTKPTFKRFLVLLCGLIVTMGRRSVSRALLTMRPMLKGHWSNYHRIFSSAQFSMWKLAAVLVRQVVKLLPAGVAIVLLGDETVDGKEGEKVWAKSAHRDPVRSSRKKGQVKFGHKWLTLCILVWLPGLSRPWALPVLCGLCLSPKVAGKLKRPPKTASQLTRQLLIVLMRWLPDRKFVLIGDYQVVTHQTVCFARRHADRVTAIGRLRGDANFYAAPQNPNRRARGGKRAQKGSKLPSPQERISQLQLTEQEVQWYGGSRRTVKFAGEQTLWFNKHSGQVAAIGWVCVLGDKEQNRHDAYFFSSDPTLPAQRIIELYASRWNIEVTFEEARALLGLETTRHWCRQSVLRVTPIMLGLFTVVALVWAHLPKNKRRCFGGTPCYRKTTPTFADVLFCVRREFWQQCLLMRHRGQSRCLDVLPRTLRQTILSHLAAAS
jgi:hypothetical protein